MKRFWPFDDDERPIYESLNWDLPGKRLRRRRK